MIKIEGRNGISVTVLADSLSENGKRLTTFELEYHRMIHAEALTHRVTSRNASSSRAVPLQKAIQNIRENPAFPVHWGAAQNGMQADEEISGETLEQAKLLWQKGIDQSIDLVNEFDKLGVHKQIAARWLETCQMIKVIKTATDWDNLLWLRNDVSSQPEFKELAGSIQEAMDQSIPRKLAYGEWHLPFIKTERDDAGIMFYIDSSGGVLTLEEALKISASCAAQVSFRKLNDSKEKALEIYEKLFSGPKLHMSPTEHQGTPIHSTSVNVPWNPSTWQDGVTHVTRNGGLHSGNFDGFIQFRQTLKDNVFTKCSHLSSK